MFTKHVGYMGNCIGDFFKQCNMYCGKSALLKGQKSRAISQEICAICTWGCKMLVLDQKLGVFYNGDVKIMIRLKAS